MTKLEFPGSTTTISEVSYVIKISNDVDCSSDMTISSGETEQVLKQKKPFYRDLMNKRRRDKWI
jgi:hypothetical protein